MWAPVLEVLPGPAWFGTGAKLGYIVAVRLVETVLGNRLRLVGRRLLQVLRAPGGAVGDLPTRRPGHRRAG
jgi:hypothetical protein